MKKKRMTVYALTERAWEIPGLSAQQRLVLLHLIRISKNGECSIGIQELADRFQLGHRQMTNVIAVLVGDQLIERRAQISRSGGRLPNIYRIVATIIMGMALTSQPAKASPAAGNAEKCLLCDIDKNPRRKRCPHRSRAAA